MPNASPIAASDANSADAGSGTTTWNVLLIVTVSPGVSVKLCVMPISEFSANEVISFEKLSESLIPRGGNVGVSV